jgi:hypothetical protein
LQGLEVQYFADHEHFHLTIAIDQANFLTDFEIGEKFSGEMIVR